MRKLSSLSAVIALTLLSACASSRDVEGVLATGGAGCTKCHGGLDNQTGAPPVDAEGLTSSAAIGAHTAHLDAGVACASCHANVNLQDPNFPNHRNGVANVDFSGVAVDPASAATPVFTASTFTCSNVYCHASAKIAQNGDQGSGPFAPQWNAPKGSISGCGACHLAPAAMHAGSFTDTQCASCHPATMSGAGTLITGGAHLNGTVDVGAHPAGWATVAANGTTPHGLAATYQNKTTYPTGFDGCRRCHGADLATPVVTGVPSCDACHTGGTAAWRTDCTFCHGDASKTRLASVNDPANVAQGAPPRDVAGNATSAIVGAHQTHLYGKAVSTGVACSNCHAIPTSFEPHADGTVDVTTRQPGATTVTGGFDPATGTCASTYCHGNLPRNPKTGNTPAWTDTSGQSSCDSCHAANGALCGSAGTCGDVETALHEAHRCARCHGNYTTTSTGGPNPFSTQVGCFACHPSYQRQLTDRTTGASIPAVTDFAIHVDGAVEVVGTTSGLYYNFSLNLSYTPPSGTTPASCATNCHGISSHQPPIGNAPDPSVVPTTIWQ